MISRRDFGRLALASAATVAEAAIQSTIEGIRIGASGYSFQVLPLDEAIAAMQRIGLGFVEVWSRHIEPKLAREALRDWRLSVSLDEYRKVAEKYRSAGIEIVALTFDLKEDFSDAELERGFEMAQALGTGRIATSTTFRVVQRILPLMEK
jgi:sugar phosphate isomerase/epimerase